MTALTLPAINPSNEPFNNSRIFARALAMNLSREQGVSQAVFNFLRGSCPNEEFAGIVGKIVYHGQNGDVLADALARFPGEFPDVLTEGIRSRSSNDGQLIDFLTRYANGEVKL